MSKKIITFLVLLSFGCFLVAESLEEKLEKFASDNAKSYLQPLANSVGAGMNSGFYHSARVLKPFMPSLKIGSTLVLIPSSDKSFIAKSPSNLVYEGDVKTATIFGDKGGTFIGKEYGSNKIDDLKLPNGADLSLIPVPQASVSIGLPYGNELMFRYLPPMEISKEIGDIGFWGIGVKHSIDQYLTGLFPVDLSVQAVYQKMDIADIVKINTFALNAQVSKKLLMLTFYGGLGYENASLEVDYNYKEINPENPDLPIDVKTKIKMDAENSVKATAGLRYSILLFDFYADYSIAHTPTINLGVGVGF